MKRVLIVSSLTFVLDKMESYFLATCKRHYQFIQCQQLTLAEDLLVDADFPVALLVLEMKLEGSFRFLQQLYQDELFTFLPVLGLVERESEQDLRKLFRLGCQYHLETRYLNTLFIWKLRSILDYVDKVDRLEKRSGFLQEKAIHDFILLDIIKNYIPRTIWHLAENFAERQRFSIPESDLELTICFGDICNFSSFAQFRSPQEVITMLNRLFEIITRYIYFFNGDVDKFIGDAFLGVFTDLRLALVAMFGIQQEIQRRNRDDTSEPLMQFRVGVHVGRIIRGNVGGHNRFDNTLIGDAVNTASRLEGKAPPGGIVVSEEVRRRLQLDIPLCYRLASELKGRQGEEIYWNIFDFFVEHPGVMPELSRLAEVAALRGKTVSAPLSPPYSEIDKNHESGNTRRFSHKEN